MAAVMRVEPDADARQAEEDDEQLDEQRRVADHLHIGSHKRPQPWATINPSRCTQGADRETGHHRHDRENQGDADALGNEVPLGPDVTKVEGVLHAPPPTPTACLFAENLRSTI